MSHGQVLREDDGRLGKTIPDITEKVSTHLIYLIKRRQKEKVEWVSKNVKLTKIFVFDKKLKLLKTS